MSNVTAVDFVDGQHLREQQVASIISNVPLISVGLMALGTFTFLVAMRRAAIPYSILFVASFLSFSAAILDLSKVLAEVKNADIITGPSQRLGIVRDVGLASSVGLIYIFMWLFVAERPQAETSVVPQQLQMQDQHSASWHRWGIFGEILKWLSLALCLVTPPLRITWHRLDSVYKRDSLLIANATLEVVLSAIFIFKLILNMSLGDHNMRWTALRDYLVPITAMAVSAALAICNLATVPTRAGTKAFTDATVGQFLLSIEIYILLLFVLINAFYQDIKFAAPPVDQEQASSTVGVQEREVDWGRRPIPSPWIGPRRAQNIDRRESGSLRNIADCVLGQSMMIYSMHEDAVIPEGASPINLGDFEHSALTYSLIDSKPLPELPEGDDVHSRRTGGSLSSYSLSGHSITTIDRILHHKETLQRMTTRSETTSRSNRSSTPSTKGMVGSPRHRRRKVSNASDRLLTLASASDLSLSSFPVPPPSAVRPHSPQSLIAQWITRKSRRKTAYFPAGTLVIPGENPQSDLLTIPSDTRIGHNSAGTQYDVTSFIDDLATPKRRSSIHRASDSTWHEKEPKNGSPSTMIVQAAEQGSVELPMILFSDSRVQLDASVTGSPPPPPGANSSHSEGGGQAMKTRPRPPPIIVPGA
ncbi:hypothetical protein AX15_007173 [Amanita polypyramis BW_CC]|nr:hypothetical protein AX15_007173 [Amanita polypyramis BW_CC]